MPFSGKPGNPEREVEVSRVEDGAGRGGAGGPQQDPDHSSDAAKDLSTFPQLGHKTGRERTWNDPQNYDDNNNSLESGSYINRWALY